MNKEEFAVLLMLIGGTLLFVFVLPGVFQEITGEPMPRWVHNMGWVLIGFEALIIAFLCFEARHRKRDSTRLLHH